MSTSRGLGAVAELAASQHGVVTRSQAAEIHLPRNAVTQLKARGFWTEPGPGVLVVTAAPCTWMQRVLVAAKALDGAPIVSHATAARLHGIEGFDADDRVVVTLERGRKHPVDGVTVHCVTKAVSEDDVIVVDGVRCTTIARTLVDLAATEPADVVERALDDFERRNLSLKWLELTATRLHRPGQRGTNLVLRDVAARRVRGRVRGSWFQKLVKECLASPLIPGLVEEYEIRRANGTLVARVDLAVPLVKVGIEGHSRRWHMGAGREAFDQNRDNLAAEEGWDLRYVGYADTKQTPRQVRQFVERLVARRARDLGVTLPIAK